MKKMAVCSSLPVVIFPPLIRYDGILISGINDDCVEEFLCG